VTLSAPDTSMATLRDESDARGRFGFDDLVPGRYLIQAHLAGIGLSHQMWVQTSPDEQDLALVLFPVSTIRGRILRAGVPEAEQEVCLLTGSAKSNSWIMERAVVTGDDGAFLFEELAPDRYVVSSKQAWRQVDLSEGGERELTIELEPELVEVRVYYRGRPLEGSWGIQALPLDPQGMACGSALFANVEAGGLALLPRLEGRLLFMAGSAMYPDCGIPAWTEEGSPGMPARIDLCDGELYLEGWNDPDAPAPKLRVLAIDGVLREGESIFTNELPGERTPTGGWRYLGVPPHADLQLEGLDEKGVARTKRFRSPDSFPGRISWP